MGQEFKQQLPNYLHLIRGAPEMKSRKTDGFLVQRVAILEEEASDGLTSLSYMSELNWKDRRVKSTRGRVTFALLHKLLYQRAHLSSQ